jgi:uncharacterized protein YecE (DUF72 family)
MGAVL